MITVFFAIVWFFVAVEGNEFISGQPSISPSNSPSESFVANSIFELGLDVSVDQWSRGNTGNVVISPLGIGAMLSIVLLCAKGESYAQLWRALHFPNDVREQTVHDAFRQVLEGMKRTQPGVSLSLESGLFVLEDLPIFSTFTDVARSSYGIHFEGVNFFNSPSSVMDAVNGWVDRSSKGEITNFITRPFRRDTKFVAVNVVYFNSNWEFPFDDQFTQDGTFNTGTKNVSIPMMLNIAKLPFLQHDSFKMVSLPYKGGKYSMVIMTPNPDGQVNNHLLQALESNLNNNLMQGLLKLMTVKRVSIKIPKMRLGSRISLKDTLHNLDVTNLFDARNADLSRLTSNSNGVFVDDIVHEATLEVTESGTVAAAATAATFDRAGGTEIFHLNRPSLIYIVDNLNGLILFSCRLIEPQPI